MYRQCSCLYRYSAYIFNIGTYSDPYSSIGATLILILIKRDGVVYGTQVWVYMHAYYTTV